MRTSDYENFDFQVWGMCQVSRSALKFITLFGPLPVLLFHSEAYRGKKYQLGSGGGSPAAGRPGSRAGLCCHLSSWAFPGIRGCKWHPEGKVPAAASYVLEAMGGGAGTPRLREGVAARRRRGSSHKALSRIHNFLGEASRAGRASGHRQEGWPAFELSHALREQGPCPCPMGTNTALFGAGMRKHARAALEAGHPAAGRTAEPCPSSMGPVPGVPGRELDDSSCRLSRTPSSYKASFCTIFCRAGLMTIRGGRDEAELLTSDPGAERAPLSCRGRGPWALLSDAAGLTALPSPQLSSLTLWDRSPPCCL